MPTIRSHYNLEQFEKVLQKLAHEIAVDAVTNLNNAYANITIHGSRLTHVETGKVVHRKSQWGSEYEWDERVPTHKFRFFAKHMSYYVLDDEDDEDGWGFDVEEKKYLTSNHSTKISIDATEEKREQVEKKITELIDRLMAEASIKPIPRFTLSKAQGAQHYLDLDC